ncbi:MAG: adenylate/guanylate cyclase domain-containing protein [Patescibacteria group bacterium]
MRHFLRRVPAWAISLLIPFIVLGASLLGLFGLTQERFTDFLFTRQDPLADVVIVEIDEQSITTVGQWPWPRQVFGRLVTKLSHASVIGIDVNFKEPSRLGNTDDESFARALRSTATPIVLTAEAQPDGSFSHPIAPFRSIALEGFPNLVIGKDGIARVIRLSRGAFPSFSLAIAQQYAHTINATVTLPPVEPTRIHFYGPNRTFSHISVIDILQNKIPDTFIRGKIVLIGATASDLQDYHLTPFDKTSGVEIQATIVSTILQQKYFSQVPIWSYLAIILLGIVAVIFTVYIESITRIIIALLGLFGLYTIGAFILFDNFIILDIFFPNIALIGSAVVSVAAQYVTANQEKRFIRETFSRYLAPQVIQELMQDPSKIKLGGQKSTLSILFSDIRSFTTLSEKMTPERLTQFLNRYLSTMTDIVLEHTGVIDKYIGDAIMAFWGAPLENPNHAHDAVTSALAMIAALKKFNEHNQRHGEPAIDIGIGINSGDVTVGNMGSEKRFDYTVMGDNVNLASRLEGLTKEYGVNIIISGATATLLANKTAGSRFLLREIDRVQVKGKQQGVTIFQVVAQHKRQTVQTLWDDFEHAREHYYAGRWDDAIALFEKILQHVPADGPSKTLLARSRELQAHPPTDWQGVYQMTHK